MFPSFEIVVILFNACYQMYSFFGKQTRNGSTKMKTFHGLTRNLRKVRNEKCILFNLQIPSAHVKNFNTHLVRLCRQTQEKDRHGTVIHTFFQCLLECAKFMQFVMHASFFETTKLLLHFKTFITRTVVSDNKNAFEDVDDVPPNRIIPCETTIYCNKKKRSPNHHPYKFPSNCSINTFQIIFGFVLSSFRFSVLCFSLNFFALLLSW